MYEIISVLRQSAIVLDFDVLELIDEDSVKLIKIKAILKENWLLYIIEKKIQAQLPSAKKRAAKKCGLKIK